MRHGSQLPSWNLGREADGLVGTFHITYGRLLRVYLVITHHLPSTPLDVASSHPHEVGRVGLLLIFTANKAEVPRTKACPPDSLKLRVELLGLVSNPELKGAALCTPLASLLATTPT